MSSKRRKKRKQEPIFDYDAIKAQAFADKSYFSEVKERIAAINDVDIARLLSSEVHLNEDEALHLLATKLSFVGVCNLRNALNHVPKNITRVLNGIPLRTTLVHQVFTKAKGCSTVSLDDMLTFVNFAETYCANFIAMEESEEHLWQLTDSEKLPYNKFLTPPISVCMQCEKELTVRNNPSRATLFTLDGPVPSTKVTLECRDCSVVYGVCRYSNDQGEHYYPKGEKYQIELVKVIDVTFLDLRLYKWFPALSNHCWVSFSGFSEAYNDVCERNIQKYQSLLANENVTEPAEDSDVEDLSHSQPTKAKATYVLPGELSSKILAKCFWQREVEEELDSIGLREEWTFTSKESSPLSGTNDHVMEVVDGLRSAQLYLHNCSEYCRGKGCGKLYVADGNWKLRYAHCMWKVPVSIKGFGPVNYPRVCPLSPKRGRAFCEAHCVKAEELGYPAGLRDFYSHCGISNIDITAALEDMSAEFMPTEKSCAEVTTCLKNIAEAAIEDGNDVNASKFQGTAEFLQNNPSFVEDQTLGEITNCHKDTGGLKAFHSWSRGVFFIVSAGGLIEYWQPLYRSESPTQAFLVTVLWLYRKFKDMKETHSDEQITMAMSSICLAYDNMCHMDSLKMSKSDLPFPKPFNQAWKLISKVIDRLHLRNHVDPKCKKLYNADDVVPKQFNTMACEQTFICASRFKRVMCAMPHVHQFFFLHRLVKYRNTYTAKCHHLKKTPVLPKMTKKT